MKMEFIDGKISVKDMLLILFSVLGLYICSNIILVVYAEESTVSGNDLIVVTELDMGDYSDKMVIGEKQLLSVTVLPYNAAELTITYESSNTEVATVNGMGRITAVAVGTTEIKASCDSVSASFLLQVTEETGIKVTDIEVANHEDELEVDKTMYLSATVLPADATDSSVKYRSSDTSIATVSSSGEIKGISKGRVIIYVSAGTVTKEVPITVKVATSKIELNSDYLVLKPEETYQLKATVTPADAEQGITYRSVDKEIATINENGLVTAQKTGNTTIIVSNGDSTVAVSVIVNESSDIVLNAEKNISNQIQNKVFAKKVNASEVKKIDSETLYYLYSTGQLLQILGEGYTIEIDGNKILNYNNELYTDIELSKDESGTYFVLNQGKYLCGEINLRLDDYEGKYLYLYNESKEKYEMLQVDNLNKLALTTPGKYLITSKEVSGNTVVNKYILIVGGVAIVIGICLYIGLKKRYWFW